MAQILNPDAVTPDEFAQIKVVLLIEHAIFAQIRPELLHTDRELEQLKEVLFAHVNAALRNIHDTLTARLVFGNLKCLHLVFLHRCKTGLTFMLSESSQP